jgi:hypothetical protein
VSNALTGVRAACLVGASLLLVSKLWAGLTGDLAATMASAGDDPWGIVSLVMLYAGLAGFALVLWRLEPDRRIAALVLAMTPLIGNAAPALWLAWRGGAAFRRTRSGG